MIYENMLHWKEIDVLWEHWFMFPDWRYFIVETHSSEVFINLFCSKLITEEEMNKYNELIGMDWGRIVDMDKFNNMLKNLIRAWFIQVQGWYLNWAKIYYKEINKEQRDTFNKMWIKIDESKQFIISKD